MVTKNNLFLTFGASHEKNIKSCTGYFWGFIEAILNRFFLNPTSRGSARGAAYS